LEILLEASGAKILDMLSVASPITLQFWRPIRLAGFGRVRGFAAVLAPETAMNEDHFTPAGKNQVWLSGQVWTVKPVAAAHGVEQAAARSFRALYFSTGP
jgi:hypothetical protein